MVAMPRCSDCTWIRDIRTSGGNCMLSVADIDQKEKFLRCLERQGYLLDSVAFATGRPDRATLALKTKSGLPVVAKFYPTGGGEQTYASMERLWNSSFGKKRNPPGL